jgi:hypothetical protein
LREGGPLPWLERVASEANLADPVSRDGLLDVVDAAETVWGQECLVKLLEMASGD